MSRFIFAFALVLLTAGFALAQPATKAGIAADRTIFNEYRGLKIGMPTADVRSKLGKPKDQSDALDLFAFSESETAQFYYDSNHVVNAIMITFQGDVSKAPTAKDVFGNDVAPNAEGTIFKMERYPKAGYWISYTRTTTGDLMVNIAMQKM